MSNDIYKKIFKLKKYLKESNHHSYSNMIDDIGKRIKKNAADESGGTMVLQISLVKLGTMEVSTSENSRSPIVFYIQNLLKENGYSLARHGVDGIFGPETKSVLKKFQADNNLEETGVVRSDELRLLEIKPKSSGLKSDNIIDSNEEQERVAQTPSSQETEVQRRRAEGDVLYLGDSQMVGNLGDALMSVAGAGTRMAKTGSRASYWAGRSELRAALERGPSKIIISLNGNGISGTNSLVEYISEHATGNPSVVWTGAPPPLYRPNGGTWADYLTTRSGYAESYNKRKGWNDTVKGIVESAGWTFIDPYDHMLLAVPIEYDGNIYRSGYECSRCDGIHLTSSAANDYVSKISGYL